MDSIGYTKIFRSAFPVGNTLQKVTKQKKSALKSEEEDSRNRISDALKDDARLRKKNG